MMASSAPGRAHDVIGVFPLPGVQRADRLVAEKLGEADDGGERRAQLVGDVVDEVVPEVGGALQRVVPLRQRPLDVHARGHVDEGQERGAVRQGLGGAVEDDAVAPLEPQAEPGAQVREAGDRAPDLRPGLVLRRRAAGRCADHLVDVGPGLDQLGGQAPERTEGTVRQLEAAVACRKRRPLPSAR